MFSNLKSLQNIGNLFSIVFVSMTFFLVAGTVAASMGQMNYVWGAVAGLATGVVTYKVSRMRRTTVDVLSDVCMVVNIATMYKTMPAWAAALAIVVIILSIAPRLVAMAARIKRQ